MPIKPRNQGQKITPAVVAEVIRLSKLNMSAKEIGIRIGRSEIAIYNIFRLYRIKVTK